MQTRALQTLIEISRVGSFAVAARNLNMTLSAVSMQMKGLEEELEVTLFDRSFRPPALTQKGRAVSQSAAQIVSAERALKRDCAASQEPFGTVRIGFVMTASVRLLPDFLLSANTCFPRVDWEITNGLSEALETDVLAGRLDAAVVTASELARPGLRYDTIRRESLCFAMPPAASGRSTEEIVSALPFLQFAPDSGVGKLIAAHAAKRGFPTAGTLVLENVESIMQCVNRGIGFSLLPLPDIERYAEPGTDIRTMPAKDALARDVSLATRSADTYGISAEDLLRCFPES